jgi:hypothetical protein
MFTVLLKNFGGRKSNRYFRKWEKAKAEMNKDVQDCCASLGGKVIETIDRMNAEKGFYEYEKRAKFPDGEVCSWSLIDGYFEDENE